MSFMIFSYLFLLKDRNSSSLPIPNVILLILIKSGVTLLPREIPRLVFKTTVTSRVNGTVELRILKKWYCVAYGVKHETLDLSTVRLRTLAFQSFELRLVRTRENEQEERSLVRLPPHLPRFNSRGTDSTTEIHKPSFRVLALLQSESDSLSVVNLLSQFS